MTIIYGTSGNDTGINSLIGGTGTDTIWGLMGNDTLRGESGNDFLYGGSGNDSLHGGLGADRMVGGQGDDIFLYTSYTESSFASGSGFDTISNFNDFPGGDKIDVSQIDADETVAGNQAFTVGDYTNGVLTGQIKTGANTFVEINIVLAGNPPLDLNVDVIL